MQSGRKLQYLSKFTIGTYSCRFFVFYMLRTSLFVLVHIWNETIRLRGDLIEVYKILSGILRTCWSTRSHLQSTYSEDITLSFFSLTSRLLLRNFFPVRVVAHRNSLPQHVVEATPVNCSSRLDRHWRAVDIKHGFIQAWFFLGGPPKFESLRPKIFGQNYIFCTIYYLLFIVFFL